jgi:formate/nitrite transporter FocA (FNT family)
MTDAALTAKHQEKIAEKIQIPEGEIIYRAVRRDGDDALQWTSRELAWSGFAAGISMGFSMAAEGALRAHLPQTDWSTLVAKLGYAAGFLIVILGRQQLFTEQTLTVVLPLLSKNRREGSLNNVARLWTVVLLSNLLGAALFAAVAVWTPVFHENVRAQFSALGAEALAPGALTTAFNAVPAGFLIAMMVWLLPGAGAARVWIVIIIAYLVGILGSAHVIAGTTDCLYVVFRGERGWLEYVGRYLIPVFTGNSVAGVGLVATLAHAQHAPRESQ